MPHLSMILSGLLMMAMVVVVAPSIFALNRGHILRNTAVWLAIFVVLALIYTNFGPDSPHPLFNMPASMAGMNRNEAPKLVLPSTVKEGDTKDNTDTGEQGFTPPKE